MLRSRQTTKFSSANLVSAVDQGFLSASMSTAVILCYELKQPRVVRKITKGPADSASLDLKPVYAKNARQRSLA